jgi:hypothetical protein
MKSESQDYRRRRLAAAGGWVGVDLDGTLAEYHGWKGHEHIGKPIDAMVKRVKDWLESGIDVRIVTARADDSRGMKAVGLWCEQHLGQVLPVTDRKDFKMIELWDDRAVQVVENTGARADGRP